VPAGIGSQAKPLGSLENIPDDASPQQAS